MFRHRVSRIRWFTASEVSSRYVAWLARYLPEVIQPAYLSTSGNRARQWNEFHSHGFTTLAYECVAPGVSGVVEPPAVSGMTTAETAPPGAEWSSEKSSANDGALSPIDESTPGSPLSTPLCVLWTRCKPLRRRAARCFSTSAFLIRVMATPFIPLFCLNGARLEQSLDG